MAFIKRFPFIILKTQVREFEGFHFNVSALELNQMMIESLMRAET